MKTEFENRPSGVPRNTGEESHLVKTGQGSLKKKNCKHPPQKGGEEKMVRANKIATIILRLLWILS
jgi:hypothetical protein